MSKVFSIKNFIYKNRQAEKALKPLDARSKALNLDFEMIKFMNNWQKEVSGRSLGKKVPTYDVN